MEENVADNDDEEVPNLVEVLGEIDSHTKRIRAALGVRLAAAETPEQVFEAMKQLGSEMIDTMLPLQADFAKAAASEIFDLNDEVFGVKLSPGEVTEIGELLTLYQAQSAGDPALSARIENAIAALAGEDPDDEDDEGDEDDEEETSGTH